MPGILRASEGMMGISGYISGPGGLGGAIRVVDEDFEVEEILQDGKKVKIGEGLVDSADRDRPGGEYQLFAMEKRGTDIYRAIRELSRFWGISRKRFSYSGTKDARAVTSQLVSVRGNLPGEVEYRSPRVRVRTPFRSVRALRFGDHWGNSFRIRVRKIALEPGSAGEVAARVTSDISEAGGVPNFFGHQRFGTLRSNTHVVGRLMLSGDFEAAVWEFLTQVYAGERNENVEFRTRLELTRDPGLGLSICPRGLSYERTVLQHLARSPRDFLGALRLLPRDLLSIFVRAYQSYIFNQALSRRLREKDSFGPRRGDIIDCRGDMMVVGEALSPDDAVELIECDGGRIVYSVVGYASGAEGPVSSEVLEVMGEMGISSSFFYLRQLPDVSPRGSYRPIRCPVYDLDTGPAEALEDGTSIKLSFRLEKGSYATVVLREYMKAEIDSY